jgi:hypothetical protein
MNDRERAAGMTAVDLGEWSEPIPDADDLVSSDLAACCPRAGLWRAGAVRGGGRADGGAVSLRRAIPL